MSTVTSKDGTKIAYDKTGAGPSVILVDGALCFRGFGPMNPLSELLSPHFTVYKFDRRGRGESHSEGPFTLQRELEDLDALIQAVGGPVNLFGTSSGGALVLEAAARLRGPIQKIAVYEVPYNSEPDALRQWTEYRKTISDCSAAGQPGEAVVAFMQLVGTPPEQLAGMRQSPMWPVLESVGYSLVADADALGEDRKPPVDRIAAIRVPALVMDGGASMDIIPFMHDSAVTISQALPNAQLRTLPGQTHDVNIQVLAPELIDFFK